MKTILLDLTGVIVHPYFGGLKEYELEGRKINLQELCGLYETNEYNHFMVGKKTEEEVINVYLERSGLEYSLRDVRHVLKETPAFIDGIEPILRELSETNKLYCLTNEGNLWVQYKVNKLGLKDYFTSIISSEDVGELKPNKEFFTKTLDFLDLKPSQCLFIDDSAKNCAASKELGIDIIHFKNARQLREELKQRAYILDN